jgi:hypothetical protein
VAKRKIAHIVNPVRVDYGTDLVWAQPLTFESMLRAQDFARNDVTVELYTAQYPEDTSIIPAGFIQTPHLERCVADVARFSKRRPLPLVQDILQRLYDATDAQYLVFTNMDITLLPHFYTTVNRYIDLGYDGLIINRRRMAATLTRPEDLPLVWSTIGKPHPGFDCFVFDRRMLPKFQLFDVAVALQYTGIGLAYSIWHYAWKFKLVDDEHLTVHIGDEVMTPRDSEYYWHSRREFNKTLRALWPRLNIEKFPYADRPLLERYYHWVTNPNFFTLVCLRLELRNISRRWRRFRYRLF